VHRAQPADIDDELLRFALRLKDWNNFAAFGCGEALKMPFGPMIRGEPSLA